jgi:flagellar biosynthesis protein FlhG
MIHRLRPHLTAIGSGKGGTGKTFVAIGLAHALAHEGERVLLCDADLGLSNTTVQLGLDSGGDLESVLAGECAIADAVVPVQGGAGKRGGFDLIALPSGSGNFANAGGRAADDLVSRLRAATQYDRVLLDLGAGIDDTVMSFAVAAEETLLVLTPDPAALTDAYAFVKLLLRAYGAAPFVVVNMAAQETEARRTAEALAATCRAFLQTVPVYLGVVPRDPRVLDAMRRQCHLFNLHPQAEAARALEALARRLHIRMAPRAALALAR